MSAALPPDVEADLRREFSRGIDDFRRRNTMTLGGLVLWRDLREHRLVVYCYSSKYYIENVTRDEAVERIATAREELATLLALFPELQQDIAGLPIAYHFCYDTGTGGVLLAKEENGCFEYVTSKA